jgi:hypothetical protein
MFFLLTFQAFGFKTAWRKTNDTHIFLHPAVCKPLLIRSVDVQLALITWKYHSNQ